MSVDRASLDIVSISFASVSIGCKKEHALPEKLKALSAAGFKAIELGFPDLQALASTYHHKEVKADAYDELCTVGKVLKAQLDAQGMKVLMLQPFANFEGWADGSDERRDAFDRARGWIKIMASVGTDLLQVGSSDTPSEKIGIDRKRFVSDLRELCDLLAEQGFRLAYENWCWSTHAPDWKDVWDIVEQINRPNIGLCLDTFQSAGGEWADPTTQSGLREDIEDVEGKWKKSCEELSKTVPKDKIYLLQISDAYKPKKPMAKEPDPSGTRPRGRWSHDFRPLPYDGGYLPVVDFSRAVLQTGFRGWFSYEVFDGGPDGTGRDYELLDYAKQGFACHKRLMEDCAS